MTLWAALSAWSVGTWRGSSRAATFGRLAPVSSPGLVLGLVGALVAPLSVSAQQGEDGGAQPTTQDGVYTAEQAARGKQVYQGVCVECHTLDFYKGATLRSWEGTPVFGLYDLIRNRMPESNPGSLKSREYVDIIAYILELNGMPPGEDALRPRASMLKNILIKWSPES